MTTIVKNTFLVFLSFIVSLIGLGLGSVILFVALLFHPAFCERVAFPLVSAATQLDIVGEVVSSSPLGHLSVQNLRVGPEQRPMLTSKSAHVSFRAPALLSGSFHVTRVKLENPDLRIDLSGKDESAVEGEDAQEKADSGFAWRVESLVANSANITILQQQGSEAETTKYSVSHANIEAIEIGSGRQLSLNAEGQLGLKQTNLLLETSKQAEVKGSLTFSPTSSVERIELNADLSSVHGEYNSESFGPADLSLRGALLFEPEGMRFNSLALSETEGKAKAILDGVLGETAEPSHTEPLELEFTEIPLTLVSLVAPEQQNLAQGSLNGAATISPTDTGVRVTGRLESTGLKLEELSEPVDTSLQYTFSSDEAEGMSLDGNLSVTGLPFEQDTYDARLEFFVSHQQNTTRCENCELTLTPRNESESASEDIKPILLRIASATVSQLKDESKGDENQAADAVYKVNANIEKVRYRTLSGSLPHVEVSLLGDRLEIDRIEGNLGEGGVSLAGWVSQEPMGGEFALKGDIKDLSLNAIDQALREGTPNAIDGTLNKMSFDIRGSELLSNPFNEQLSGKVRSSFSKIYLPQSLANTVPFNILFLPFQVTGSALGMMPGAVLPGQLQTAGQQIGRFFHKTQQLHINEGDFDVDIEDGKMQLGDVEFDTTILPHVNFSGSVSSDSSIDIDSHIGLVGVKLPLPVGGTLEKPRPDVTKFAKQLVSKFGLSVAKLPLTTLKTLRSSMPCFLSGIGLASDCDNGGKEQSHYDSLIEAQNGENSAENTPDK